MLFIWPCGFRSTENVRCDGLRILSRIDCQFDADFDERSLLVCLHQLDLLANNRFKAKTKMNHIVFIHPCIKFGKNRRMMWLELFEKSINLLFLLDLLFFLDVLFLLFKLLQLLLFLFLFNLQSTIININNIFIFIFNIFYNFYQI